MRVWGIGSGRPLGREEVSVGDDEPSTRGEASPPVADVADVELSTKGETSSPVADVADDELSTRGEASPPVADVADDDSAWWMGRHWPVCGWPAA